MTLQKISAATDVSRDMMDLTGIWPLKNPSLWYRLKNFISRASALILHCMMTIEVFLSLQDLLALSDIILVYFTYFTYIVKQEMFQWNKDEVLKLANDVEDPLLNNYEERHETHVRWAIKRSSVICQIFKYNCALVGVSYLVAPLMEETALPVPFSIFQEGFMWYVVYIVEMTALTIGIWNHSAFDTLCIGYMNVAIGELDILLEKIKEFGYENFKSFDTEKSALNYLNNCSKHHNKIIKLVRRIDNIFTIGLLAQFSGSIIVVCNTGFQLAITPIASLQFLSKAIYFSCMMTEVAMYCWFGNEIMLKSLDIGEACYMSKWYKYGPRVRKVIFIIMERSKKPLKISAYKFADLSLQSYRTIISWSYSYFTVLWRLYKA